MSGFLSSEDFEKADGLIRDSFPVEDDGDGFIGEPIEAQEESVEAKDGVTDIEEPSDFLDEDVKLDDGEEEVPDGHRVPYNRFKSVLDARNEYKGEIETLRERNRELEAYLGSKSSQPTPQQETSSYEDEYYGYEDYSLGDSYGQEDTRMKQLEDQMHGLRVQHHKQQLMRDMEVIRERYPNVPEEAVLQAVANDPTTNIYNVAESFHSFLAEKEEAAIQRYLKSQEGQAPADSPKAAPRPRKSGGGEAPGSSRVPRDKRPKQMKDVRHALLNYVKDNNIF
mgnify:CR=1 FL=1